MDNLLFGIAIGLGVDALFYALFVTLPNRRLIKENTASNERLFHALQAFAIEHRELIAALSKKERCHFCGGFPPHHLPWCKSS